MYSQFIIIFALILTGYLLRKYNIIDDAMNNGVNRLIMLVALPCLIIHKMSAIEAEGSLMRDFLICIAVSAAIMYLCGGYAALYAKLRRFPRESASVAEFSMVTPNNAFLGFPVAYIFFGEMGLLMMIAANVAMNIYMFTYGVVLLDRGKESVRLAPGDMLKALLRKLASPIIASMIVGFAICLAGIRLPEALSSYLEQLGSLCTPLSMIYIGSSLAGSSISKILRNRVIVETTINKLIVIPAITAFIVSLLPLTPYAAAAIVLSAAFPTAALVSILVQQKGGDAELSGEILFLTTVGSAVTLLPIISLINALFLS